MVFYCFCLMTEGSGSVSSVWLIRIREAQNLIDPPDPESQHCWFGSGFALAWLPGSGYGFRYKACFGSALKVMRIHNNGQELPLRMYPDPLYCKFSSRICREEGCGQRNVLIKPVPVGGGLRVHTRCPVGHYHKWESTEFYNKVWYSVVLIITSATLITMLFYSYNY